MKLNRYRHGFCGKIVRNSAYHCGGCCETFVGETAFVQHRRGMQCSTEPVKDPYAKGQGFWLDDEGYWHVGAKMTQEQKEKLGWV